MPTRNFFRDLDALESFEFATDTTSHKTLPNDWTVVVADVVGSTKAIESGRYKDVNTVGAATIMAVLNVDRSTEIPFVFGGDGALLAIPEHMRLGTRNALLGSQQMAHDVFKLDLRVAMIPVKDILSRGLTLNIAKYKQGRYMTHTSMSGGGWAWAESFAKNASNAEDYGLRFHEGERTQANFSGLECRWEPVRATNDYKLCLIVKSLSNHPSDQDLCYQNILTDINRILGPTENHHPLSKQNLRLSLNPFRLYDGFRALNQGIAMSAINACCLVLKSTIGRFAVTYNLKLKGVYWGQYRDEMIENADYRKFDGTLKMVLDASEKQADLITSLLDSKQISGDITYGIHRSKTAIMTCLVFSDHQNHAHFVDGSDGGYALAAKMLKSQHPKNN